ncbi:MAG: glycosyltransferase, partial [Pseudomonadota bacterium]|nr:glycosyltransferase [Pseudomonadota bacterium]
MSTLLVMAGGTGGHVMPALAAARELKSRGVEVVWLGTREGLESRLVPAAGFDLEWIKVSGLRHSGWRRKLTMPLMLANAGAQALRVILRRRPDGLLGMGGFVAGPGGAVGALLRLPLVIHEQNAVAGLTNRLLARIATRVLLGFPKSEGFARKKTRWVGNPVRRSIAALPAPEERLADRNGALRVLVIGGSQG